MGKTREENIVLCAAEYRKDWAALSLNLFLLDDPKYL